MKAASVASVILLFAGATVCAQASGLRNDVRYLKKRAEKMLAERDFRGAEVFLRDVAKRFPKDAEVHVLHGESLFLLERPAAAAEAFARGLARDESLLPRVPHYPLALLRAGRLDAAKKTYVAMERVAPDDRARAKAAFGLGLVALHRGDREQALGDLERAVTLDSRATKARYRLGQLLVDLGRYDEAIGHLRRVIEQDGLHEAAAHQLALACHRAGQAEEAARWRERHREIRRALIRISGRVTPTSCGVWPTSTTSSAAGTRRSLPTRR